MTAVTLPNLGIKSGFEVGESGWADEMNLALRMADALSLPRVVHRGYTTPPSATGGDLYIVGGSATGAWSGHDGELALWCIGDDIPAGEWAFVTAKEGWRVWVIDEDAFYQFDGSVWVLDSSSEVLPSRYAADFGDGAAAAFNIVHNLNTRDVRVTVYRNASPYDDIVCDIARPDVNTVELSGFVGAPSSNEFRVTISK